MANSDHVAVVARGAQQLAQWRELHPDNALDLSQADLKLGNLAEADLRNTRLDGVNLAGADLSGSDLSGSSLRQAVLTRANLSDAVLAGCDLSGAVLSGADLSRARFEQTNLTGADLSEAFAVDAEFQRAVLAHANLTSAYLLRTRFVKCDLTDALVENSVVSDVVVQDLKGRPRSPQVLWFDGEAECLVARDGRLLVVNDAESPITGRRAQTFFLEAKLVEVVWEKPFSETAVLAYQAFQAVCREHGDWPEDVRFAYATTRAGRVRFVFEGASVRDVLAQLPRLLEPFELAHLVDWEKTFAQWSRSAGRSSSPRRSSSNPQVQRWAQRLSQHEGFSDNLPFELAAGGVRVRFAFQARPISEPDSAPTESASSSVDLRTMSVQMPGAGSPLALAIQLLTPSADRDDAPRVSFLEARE